jgi:hypothetical protein
MARHHNINGNIVPFTAEEEAARDAEEARIESAKTKLQDLGLTLDEVKDAFNI